MADLQDRTRAQHATPGVCDEELARGAARHGAVASVVHVTANASRARSAR